MQSFSYTALDLERPATRLVQLLKGEGPVIECLLHQVFLDGPDTVPYHALSYTWGGTEKTSTVMIDGKPLGVTENLYVALQYLRLEDEDQLLWVDAICIDQENLEERGHQVRHMCKIYSQAEEVLVWLGRATEETDILMYSLHRLEKYRLMHPNGNWQLEYLTGFWSSGPQTGNMNPRKGLELLLQRPWFRRVWILQEIANARRARVWCGTKSIKAQTLVLAPELLGVTPGSHCQAVLDIMPGRLREKSWWCKSRTLHTLLLKFKESEASDPRDKIYALLGITSDTQSINVLHPDYTKSFWDVVRDTSSFLFGPSDVRYGTTSEFEERLVSQNASSFCQLIISSNATEIGNSLMQQGIEVPLVEDMITAAAWNLNVGKDIITLFLHQRGNKTRIIEMLRAAAGGELERYILDLPRHPATAEPVTIFDSERLIMASLNKKRRYGIKVTEEVFRAAVGNERSGMGVMTLLFQLRRSEVEMSAVREAVAETGNYGKWSTKHIKTLQEAFASGHSTTINMLLDEIAVRDFWEFPSGVLFGALETGYMAIVNRLLGEDGGLNIGDLEGRYMTLVKLLLDEDAELTRGSMLSSLDSDELLLASYIGYAAAVKSLVASWMRAKSR